MNTSILNKLYIGVLLILVTAAPAFAADATLMYTSTELIKKTDDKPSAEIGTRHSDMLVGTGKYTAYLLSKGNLISKSDFVSVGIKRMKRDTDYTINYNTGSLQFNSVIKAGETIRVDYRYKGDGTPIRNVVDPTASMLKFGSSNSNAVLNFGYKTSDANAGAGAADILTYGLNTAFSVNQTTKLTGLVYSATPETPNRISFSNSQKNVPKQNAKTTAKKGNLLVQNLESKLGKLGFTATYQNVDETYQGFQTMREAGNIDQNLINQLEKQRGTKRTGFTADLPTGKDTALKFSTDSLADSKGAIKTQSISLGGPKLQMSMRTVDNSKDFTHYTDDQTRKESGIKRTYSDLKFADKFGSLAFNQTSIKDNRSQSSPGIDIKGFSFTTSALSVNVTSRDIDKNFTRGNDLAEPERAVLASERGIKRNTTSIKLRTSKTSSLSFDQGVIKDNLTGSGATIDTRGFAFSTGGLNLSMSTRKVDKNFTRANDLGDADKAQIAAEVGIKRTTTALSLRTGVKMDKSPAWSSFSESRLDSDSTHYSRRSMDMVFGKLRAQVTTQAMSPDFNRIGALNVEDRKQIALAARKQFDVNAQIGHVSQDDINRTYNETGLNRSNYSAQWDDKGYALAVSMSNINTANTLDVGLNRTALSVTTPKYTFYYKRHDIDSKFNRLSSLQPVEIGAYGNEYGMERVEFGTNTKLLGGNVNYLKADIKDSTTSSILKRSSFDYTGKNLRAKVNFLSVPDEFKRIGDLSNSQEDKNYFYSEAGFDRQDYWANFQANAAINIDTYLYNAGSSSRKQDKSQQRISVSYAPKAGPRITAFSDRYDFSSRDSGNIYRYDHRIISFDQTIKQLGALAVTGSHDVNAVSSGADIPTETTVDKLKLERYFGKYTKFTYESTDTETNKGYYDKNKKYSIETPITRDLALVGNYATRDLVDDNQDEENYVLGLRYALNSKLSMTFYSVTNTSKAAGVTRSTQITASGLIAKRFGPLSDVTVNTSLSSSENRYKETARNDKTTFQAGFYGGLISVEDIEELNPQTGLYSPRKTTTFATSDDPKRWYQIKYMATEFKDSTGKLVHQDTADASFRLTPKSSLILNTYSGTKQANTPNNALIIQPISGNRYSYNNVINTRQSIYADYSIDQNELTSRRARTFGAGTKGELAANSKYDVYYGYARLSENGRKSTENVYRASIDYRVNSDHFLVFSAQKKSNLDSATINPDEGKTVFKLDYQSVFD